MAAAVELLLPPLRCRCHGRAAAKLPPPRPHCRQAAAAADKLPAAAKLPLLMQRDLPLSNADGGSVLEYNLVIEDY